MYGTDQARYVQSGQPITGYFYGNDKYHYKTQEIKRNWTKLAILVGEVHFEIYLRTLRQGTVGLQSLKNTQNGGQIAGPFRVKYD